MAYRTLVVDDEPLARMRMRKLLEPHLSKVDVVGEAPDGLQGLELIRNLKPDLVFLDIQMPGLTGFELLDQLAPSETPLIIFATAFDEFAIKAFEENAIDYLLKPVEADRLAASIEKLDRLAQRTSSGLYDSLRRFIERSRGSSLQRLQVRIGDRTLLVHVRDVVRFESEDKYTTVYTDDSKYVIDTSLVELESKLDPEEFLRVHRAHLVNIGRIVEIQRQFGGKLKVVLNDKTRSAISVSRNYADKVRSL